MYVYKSPGDRRMPDESDKPRKGAALVAKLSVSLRPGYFIRGWMG